MREINAAYFTIINSHDIKKPLVIPALDCNIDYNNDINVFIDLVKLLKYYGLKFPDIDEFNNSGLLSILNKYLHIDFNYLRNLNKNEFFGSNYITSFDDIINKIIKLTIIMDYLGINLKSDEPWFNNFDTISTSIRKLFIERIGIEIIHDNKIFDRYFLLSLIVSIEEAKKLGIELPFDENNYIGFTGGFFGINLSESVDRVQNEYKKYFEKKSDSDDVVKNLFRTLDNIYAEKNNFSGNRTYLLELYNKICKQLGFKQVQEYNNKSLFFPFFVIGYLKADYNDDFDNISFENLPSNNLKIHIQKQEIINVLMKYLKNSYPFGTGGDSKLTLCFQKSWFTSINKLDAEIVINIRRIFHIDINLSDDDLDILFEPFINNSNNSSFETHFCSLYNTIVELAESISLNSDTYNNFFFSIINGDIVLSNGCYYSNRYKIKFKDLTFYKMPELIEIFTCALNELKFMPDDRNCDNFLPMLTPGFDTEFSDLINKLHALSLENCYSHCVVLNEEKLFYKLTVDGKEVKMFRPEFLPYLQLLDLSQINFENVDIRGIDFSYTNCNIDISKVYQQSAINTKFVGCHFKKEITTGNLSGADFTNCFVKVNADISNGQSSVVFDNTKFSLTAIVKYRNIEAPNNWYRVYDSGDLI